MDFQEQKIILAANWKMNPANSVEAETLFKAIKKGTAEIKNAEIIICPPFVWLSLFKKQIILRKRRYGSSFSNKIYLGAQNFFWKDKGAYTGEISPKMLKNLGCNFVILGHSERRKFLGETNQTVNKKIQAALKNRLKPIVCVGEKKRNANDFDFKEIKTQVLESFERIQKASIQDIIIAYEPVWAIGSGKTPSENDIMKAVILIRRLFTEMYSQKTAQKLKILYGGSVNSRNAANFISSSEINGFLIGKASLNAGEFVRIIKAISEKVISCKL
jgi:triosephosphate isomerase